MKRRNFLKLFRNGLLATATIPLIAKASSADNVSLWTKSDTDKVVAQNTGWESGNGFKPWKTKVAYTKGDIIAMRGIVKKDESSQEFKLTEVTKLIYTG